MKRMKNKINNSACRFFLSVILLVLVSPFVMGAAEFAVNSFSCTPSEVVINDVFSCTAQVKNNGDASGAVSVATLYSDSNNWLEDSNYAQASGTSVDPGQTTEVIFTGLRATKSDNNGFSKIMLDDVTDTYVADNNINVNVINVLVTVSNSVSSAAMSESFDVTSTVIAGGNIDISLTFTVDSGGCSIGSATNPKSISGMQEGNQQSRVWIVTHGTTTGDCEYTLSAAATGSGSIASKIDSTSSTVTCTDCPVASDDSSPSGGGGSGGGGSATASASVTYNLGDLTSIHSQELAKNERVKFVVSGEEHFLMLTNLTDTTATIIVESEKQTFIMNLEDVINVDLDGDDFAEMSIEFKSVNTITNKAKFILTRLTKPVPASELLEEKEEKENSSENIFDKFEWKSIYSKWLGGFVGIIVLLVVLKLGWKKFNEGNFFNLTNKIRVYQKKSGGHIKVKK